MAVEVTNYQCPACTGPLSFDPASGRLACDYCDSSFSVEEIEALYADKDARAAQNMAEAERKREQEKAGGKSPDESWDLSGLSSDWGAEAASMRAYNCPSCGAELICEASTAATSCPYCGNPTVVPGRFAGALRPDCLIPFKLKKDEAIAALKRHYAGKILLPKEFKDENHLEEIKGVYVPFWLFDTQAAAEASYEATRSRRYQSGDCELIETLHYDVFRAGSMNFERIPVDASSKMPDDYMDSIEPFNYEDLTDFSTAYLPGYLADKYDLKADECSPRAESRAAATVLDSLRATVSGYESVSDKDHSVHLTRGELKYALLPVWLLSTRWNGQNYLFAMNGQSGKFVGNLPVDHKKKWLLFAAVYGAAALLTAAAVFFIGL